MNWKQEILEKAGWEINVGENDSFATHEATGRLIKLTPTKAFKGRFLTYGDYMQAQKIKFCDEVIKVLDESIKKDKTK